MTRINCVPVAELTRAHLVAEYRELPRVVTMVRNRRHPKPIPPSYVLGPGHMSFFADKLGYIARRHAELIAEMKARGYRPNFDAVSLGGLPYGDWEPDEAALALNRERISERLRSVK